MHTIEWESHPIGESCQLNEYASFWNGRLYKLSYNNQSGHIVTKPSFKMLQNSICGFGYFNSTELYLQLISNKEERKLCICKRENEGESIGHVEQHRFLLHGNTYYVDVKMKNIFSSKTDGDISVDIRLPFLKKLFSFKAYNLDKKWYKNLSYDDHLHGTIALTEEPDWEFILSLFFQLDCHIDLNTNRD